MSSVGIVLTTACSRCNENFAVNALMPSLRCPRCGNVTAIAIDVWKKVLEAPALDGPLAEPNKDHIDTVRGEVSFVRNYVRKDATCARCNGEIPLPKSLAHAERGFCICVHCGDKVSVRALPRELGKMGGFTHVVGEDLATLSGSETALAMNASASRGEVVQCPQCGSAVPVDGAFRAVSCRHCQAQVVIPDAIWARLHPLPAQRVFFLWHDGAAIGKSKEEKPHVSYESLDDVIADAQGNLYFIHERHVWSTDFRLHLRWDRHSFVEKDDRINDPTLAIAPSGHLIIRAERRHGAIVLSCADGATVTTLGGIEPDGVTAHGFDLQYCEAIACDIDGTIIGLLHDRILRWTYDGRPIETWPPAKGVFGEKHQKLKPLFRKNDKGERDRIEADAEYPARVNELKDRPIEVRSDYTRCTVGWDGSLVLQHSENVAKLDRNGHVVFKLELPSGSNDYGRPGTDGYGNVYVMRGMKYDRRSIYRISADGRDVRIAIDGSAIGTPISDSRILVVLPDATIMAFNYGGSVRIFGPDGAARFISDQAREDDADSDKDKAREER